MRRIRGGRINPGGQLYAPPNECQGLRKSGQRQVQRLLRVFINCTCLNAARPLTFILGFAGMAAKGLMLSSNAMGRFELFCRSAIMAKPDISLAIKSGHFNLLRTQARTLILEAVADRSRAPLASLPDSDRGGEEAELFS